MADDVRVEVHGGPELVAGSRRLAANIEDEAGARFRGVADVVAANVRGNVPRRTGRLASSVEAIGGSHSDGAAVGLGGGVPYAGWIEFGGTRGRPYVPTGRYLYPGALRAEPLLERQGVAAANDEIRTMVWPLPTV